MSQKGLTREKKNENSGIRLKEEKQLGEGSPLSKRVNKQNLNKKKKVTMKREKHVRLKKKKKRQSERNHKTSRKKKNKEA